MSIYMQQIARARDARRMHAALFMREVEGISDHLARVQLCLTAQFGVFTSCV